MALLWLRISQEVLLVPYQNECGDEHVNHPCGSLTESEEKGEYTGVATGPKNIQAKGLSVITPVIQVMIPELREYPLQTRPGCTEAWLAGGGGRGMFGLSIPRCLIADFNETPAARKDTIARTQYTMYTNRVQRAAISLDLPGFRQNVKQIRTGLDPKAGSKGIFF
ncbi:hypothetical protein PoB_007352900 [Plakobranchus ocellatus]|uniref:Uncharacterized protein n=1 Tax=Plakobranchus ocellatus TaxID=259542 RepID=A0AAV4DSQ7_9GAST|nr:hypothetical protein PoB_007352900 [Plakobranchus ocellatus]